MFGRVGALAFVSLFSASVFASATPILGEDGVYATIRGGATGILSNDLKQMRAQMDEVVRRIEVADPKLAPELNRILNESKQKIDEEHRSAQVERARDEKRGRAQLMGVRLRFLDFARRVSQLFKKGDPVLEEIRRASGLPSLTGEALVEAQLALGIRSFVDNLVAQGKAAPETLAELFRLHGETLRTELGTLLPPGTDLQSTLDALAKRYATLREFTDAHEKLGSLEDAKGSDWVPDLMDVDDRVRLADVGTVPPVAPAAPDGSVGSAPNEQNLGTSLPKQIEQTNSDVGEPRVQAPTLPVVAPPLPADVLVKPPTGKRGAENTPHTNSHGHSSPSLGNDKAPSAVTNSANRPNRGTPTNNGRIGGDPVSSSPEKEFNETGASGARTAPSRGAAASALPSKLSGSAAQLYNAFIQSANGLNADPLAFMNRYNERREGLGLDETCTEGAQGAECRCRAAWNARPELGGSKDLNSLWRYYVDRDTAAASCQGGESAQVRAVLQSEGDPMSAYAYRAMNSAILRGQCEGEKGQMNRECLMKPDGFYDNLVKLRALKHLTNRGLMYHLSLGQVPPACALGDPFGVWLNDRKLSGPDGLDDACRELSSKKVDALSKLDRAQIYNAILFSRSVASAAEGDEPEDCGPAKAESLPAPAKKRTSDHFELRRRSMMAMSYIEHERSVSLRDGRELPQYGGRSSAAGGSQASSRFATGSRMNGLFNNLMRCTEPGQLGWAYREAEKDLRKRAIACGSVEAQNFVDQFGSTAKIRDMVEEYGNLAPQILDPSLLTNEDADLVEVGPNCDELRLRGASGGKSTIVRKLDHSGTGPNQLYPPNFCAGAKKGDLSALKRNLRRMYETDLFLRLTKDIKADRALKRDGVELYFNVGALSGATFASCAEIVDTHRVMMYTLLSPASLGGSFAVNQGVEQFVQSSVIQQHTQKK